MTTIPTFESKFAEVLTTELRRQGIANYQQQLKAVMSSTRRIGLMTWSVNCSQCHLTDRSCGSLVEALLKMSTVPNAPPEWMVNIANSSITDRVTGHLVLLLQRAHRLVLLDVSNCTELSAEAIGRISEAAQKVRSTTNPRVELIVGTTASKQESPRGGHPPRLSEDRAPVAPSEPIIDVAALKKKRDQALKDEAKQDEASKQQRKDAEAPGHRAPSIRVHSVDSRPNSRSTSRSPRRLGESKERSDRIEERLMKKTASTIAREAERKDVRTGSAHKLPHGRKPSPRSVSKPSSRPSSADARREVESVSSEETTATEVPDQQDYLDITANMNPIVDHVVALESQGVDKDTLYMRLLKELDPSRDGAGLFSSVTVLNLSQNGLDDFDGAILPQSLLRLDLSGNKLTAIPNLSSSPMLSVVNLRRNRVQRLEKALEGNLNIGHLFLGRNQIRFVEGIGHLWLLETLDLSYNAIASQTALRPLSLNQGLRHLVMKGNPLERQLRNGFRPLMRNLCPALIALDNERLVFSRVAEHKMMEDQLMFREVLSASPVPAKPTSQALCRPLHEGASPSKSTLLYPRSSSATKGQSSVGSSHAPIGYAIRSMLSRGVAGGSAGYSDPTHTASVVKKQSALHSSNKGPNGAASTKAVDKKALMSKLCEQSKQFIEKVLVEKLMSSERLELRQGDNSAKQRQAEPSANLASTNKYIDPLTLATNSAEFDLTDPLRSNNARTNDNDDDSMDYVGEPDFSPPPPLIASSSRPLPVRSETLDGDRWASERRKIRAASASPTMNEPIAPVEQKVVEKLFGSRQNSNPRDKTPSNKESPSLQGAREASGPIGTLRSQEQITERARSRSASNASSGRSPSPRVNDPSKVVALYPNEPLSSAVKYANTPRQNTTSRRPESTTPRANLFPLLNMQVTPANSGVGKRGTPTASKVPPKADSTRRSHHNDETPPARAGNSNAILSPYVDSEEVELSPEGPSMMSPLGNKFSPIRSALDMTDVSADGNDVANQFVPRMDPGAAASPIPRPGMRPQETPVARHRPQVGKIPLISPSKSEDRRQRVLSSPMPPLPQPQKRELDDAWVDRFYDDLKAVKVSLRTVVNLFWTYMHAKDNETSMRLSEERQTCLKMIKDSNMLDDTEIPSSVVHHFGFSVDELNDSNAEVPAGIDPRKAKLLRSIHEMGSSKTCLRYIVALVDGRREDLLQKYVESIRGEIA